MNYPSLPQIPSFIVFALYIWSIAWKGLALWKAANYKQRNWFIVILVVNTIGIVEIIYLFFFAKQKLKIDELKFWQTKK